MGNYEQLKNLIAEFIKTNGNQEITGLILQNVLKSIVSTLGANATYVGVATPTTNPGTPDGPVFYLAVTPGVYSNFNNIQVTDTICIIRWINGVWSSEEIGNFTKEYINEKFTELEGNIGVLDNLETAAKDNLVNAINEAASSGGGDEGLRDELMGIHIDKDLSLPEKEKGLMFKDGRFLAIDAYNIDVSKYRGATLTISNYTSLNNYNNCTFFKKKPTIDNIQFAEGWTSARNAIGSSYVVPEDAAYLNLSTEGNGAGVPMVHVVKDEKGIIDNIEDEIAELGERLSITDADEVDEIRSEEEVERLSSVSVKALVRSRDRIDIKLDELEKYVKGAHESDFDYSGEKVLGGMIYGTWKENPSWSSIAINVKRYRGKTFSVKCTGTTYVNSGVITSLNLVNNEAPPYCEGTTFVNCYKSVDISIPNDAVYLIVSASSTDSQYHPPIIKLKEDVIGVEERLLAFENKGKSIAVFGGSWALGVDNFTHIWKEVLATDKVDVYAKGGAGFGNQHQVVGTKNIQEQVAELCTDSAEPYDVYVLWASTNDFATPTIGEKIGTRDWYTDDDDWDESKLDSQCGGINYCIKMLSEKNPQAQIVFFSSCPIFSKGKIGYDNTITKEIKSNDGGRVQASFGDYTRGQRDCCDRFHIPFLDQWNMLGINEYNYAPYYGPDKTHLNAYGYTRLAYKQAGWLKNCIG